MAVLACSMSTINRSSSWRVSYLFAKIAPVERRQQSMTRSESEERQRRRAAEQQRPRAADERFERLRALLIDHEQESGQRHEGDGDDGERASAYCSAARSTIFRSTT